MPSDSAFVPAEPWLFHSPEIKRAGRVIDIGLVAEALVFYERIYFGIGSDAQYAKLVLWFQAQGQTKELIALISDGVIVPYYYAFTTNAGQIKADWVLLNLEDEQQRDEQVFEARIARTPRLNSLVKRKSLRTALDQAVMDNHVEVKAEDFDNGVENARADYTDPQRASLIVQSIYDELYPDLGYSRPPVIQAKGVQLGEGRMRLDWNVNFEEFRAKLGTELTMHAGTPLAAAGFGVKTLWSAARLKSDLYLGAPLAGYIAAKLADGGRATRSRAIVEDLVARADFPDIRHLVNHGKLGVRDVIALRGSAVRFRNWLRSESEMQRDTLAAYLGELAEEVGWKKELGKVIRVAGVVGGAVVATTSIAALGPVGGAVAGAGLAYIAELAARLDDGWTPRVFGQAAKADIARARQP